MQSCPSKISRELIVVRIISPVTRIWSCSALLTWESFFQCCFLQCFFLMQIEKLSNVFKENGEVIPKDLEVREEDKGRKSRKGKLGYKDKFASETTAFFNRILPDKKKNKAAMQVDDEDPVTVERREKVKSAMLHAWTCYETYAWGYDELEVVITVDNSFFFWCSVNAGGTMSLHIC